MVQGVGQEHVEIIIFGFHYSLFSVDKRENKRRGGSSVCSKGEAGIYL